MAPVKTVAKKTVIDPRAKKLAEMKAQKERLEKPRGTGDYEDGIYDKLVEGPNFRRILPWPSQEPLFYVEARCHYKIGPEAKTIRCLDTKKTEGQTCPICKCFLKEKARINAKYKKGDETGKAEYRKAAELYRAKERYFMNVYDSKNDPAAADIRVLAVGPQIMTPVLVFFFEGEEGTPDDITDPTTGRAMNIRRTGDGRDTEYTVAPSSKVRPLPDVDWAERLHDLEAAAGELLDPSVIRAILDGVDEVDDTAGEDVADDDEEKAPPKSAKKAKPRFDKKPREEEPEEEEETVEEAEEITAETATEGVLYTTPKGTAVTAMGKPSTKTEGAFLFKTDDGKMIAIAGDTVLAQVDGYDEPSNDEEEDGEAAVKPSTKGKPACFGDPNDHDPNDETCQECTFRTPCSKVPAVAAKLVKLGKKTTDVKSRLMAAAK